MTSFRHIMYATPTYALAEVTAMLSFVAILMLAYYAPAQHWPINASAAIYYSALTFRCGIGIAACSRRPKQWSWTWIAVWLLSTGLYGSAAIWGADNIYISKAAGPVVVLSIILMGLDQWKYSCRLLLSKRRSKRDHPTAT